MAAIPEVSGWADGDFGSGNEADFEKKAIVRGLMAAKRSECVGNLFG